MLNDPDAMTIERVRALVSAGCDVPARDVRVLLTLLDREQRRQARSETLAPSLSLR